MEKSYICKTSENNLRKNKNQIISYGIILFKKYNL